MASSSQGTVSSPLSVGSSSYDVFINFRGIDTRENFVYLLYDNLRRNGIYTFMDSEELWEGEEICPSLLRAIRRSKISIPVFSTHYADSKYCLLELAEIWDCHISDGQIVLPIFIDVEPGDVRKQIGSFQGLFQKHQRKYESAATVDGWKNALKVVGNLKGWTLKGDANIKEQSNIVEFVVQKVLRELTSTPLEEPKHLVGIDSHVRKVNSLLNIGSDDVRFVAICGMGGLGKTTIAKMVYNCIFRSFKGSSFLTDVREEASQGNKGLISLQKRLLRDIFKRDQDQDISILSRGSKFIAERLHRENILLILDDVDDHEQLDALAGGFHWFGPRSRVIITTRDDHILNVHEKTVGKDIQIYKPEEMNFENSIQLFSLHAFLENEPTENYRQLSCEVVYYAGGLPLTLEVLGSFLSDKNDKEEWENTLERLKDISNNKVIGKSMKTYDEKVFEKLMISYNKLGDPEKTIFLDVACHFSGWKKDIAFAIWEACELHPRLAIKELIQKHLLKIDVLGCLKMHDQLRYMGKRIVLKDSYKDPTKRSRLWSDDEIWKVLKEDTEIQMVEGIILNEKFGYEAQVDLSCEDFQRMPNLRFLQLRSIDNLNGDFAHLPSKLRWFRWQLAFEVIPSMFYHRELVHLDLSKSCCERLWDDLPQNENERFQKLKVLILCYSSKLSLSPNFFSWFLCLQILNLDGCSSVVEIPSNICLMASLKILSLDRCYSLKKLPTSIGDLKHLIKLSMSETKVKELPHGVGQLEKLELNISYCHITVKLPTSMGKMRSLHHFSLKGTNVVELPDDFSNLSNLEVLTMGLFDLYESIILNGSKDLEELYAEDRYTLIENLDLSNMKRLRILDISYLKNLERIHGLEGTRSLEELRILGCSNLREIPNLSNLKRLKNLNISSCENLEGIHGFEGTESLEKLHIWNLREIPDLSNLKRLKNLDISSCENIEGIHGLEGTESLEELHIESCSNLREIPDLSNLKRLKGLDISFCENLEGIHGLKGTESLEVLYIKSCSNLREIPDLSNLKRLKILSILSCENLEGIHCLKGLESLEELIATRYCNLKEIPDLSNLKKLKSLYILYCVNLEGFHGLEGTKSLEELYIKSCSNLKEIPDLSNLKRLRSLNIDNCVNLEDINKLEGMESLQGLNTSGCHRLRKIPSLSKLKSLRKLEITNCVNLEEIHGLDGPEHLRTFNAKGCYKLTKTKWKILGKVER
ncbi:hypothetical protein NE237_000551 [Protea cynaroides]|uniref:TIR domain-containing protein n=1 Tax=Protea cynaroides TaxID=273540 RepID=A0A9Q0QX90_9MAGN|nr:hypothetical protein NE237_000551 [Protea cynaroides]